MCRVCRGSVQRRAAAAQSVVAVSSLCHQCIVAVSSCAMLLLCRRYAITAPSLCFAVTHHCDIAVAVAVPSLCYHCGCAVAVAVAVLSLCCRCAVHFVCVCVCMQVRPLQIHEAVVGECRPSLHAAMFCDANLPPFCLTSSSHAPLVGQAHGGV